VLLPSQVLPALDPLSSAPELPAQEVLPLLLLLLLLLLSGVVVESSV
jgi:hypothetical protein